MRQYQVSTGVFQKFMINYVIIVLLLFIPQAQAFTVYDNDAVIIQLDSTISYGLQWRVQDRDKDIIGLANGGTKHSCNYDDGNLNYDTGLIGNAVKLTSDLDIDAGLFGIFVRGSGFYDFENEDGDRERTSLSSEAKEAVGSDIDLLDYYIWFGYEIAGMPFQIRIGDQVVSWGESTFIHNSINTINSVDVSKLRVPGAELKEALTPEGMVWASISPTENFTVEGFYEYDWEETKLDPMGTYFSGADFVGDGAFKLMLGFGQLPDQGNTPAEDTLYAVPRGETDEAKSSGQYGIALRYYSEALNNTEFSFYAMNYHSRLPILQATTGSVQTIANAGAAAGTAAAAVYAAAGVGPGASPEVDAKASQAGSLAMVDTYIKGSPYRTHYEEDLQLYGIGFNTEVGGFGWQGEISYRPDAPLQVDDLELLQTYLSVLPPLAALGDLSQLGSIGPDSLIKGFIEKDIVQLQTTLSYVLPPISWLHSDGGLIIGEVGWEHICNMPSKSDLRLEGPATSTPGGAESAAFFGEPQEKANHFADEDSCGYRIVMKLDYFNAIGPVGLSPRIGWSHDVYGISPAGGPFLEGRKAVTLGLTASYLSSWTADLSYTNYFGAGAYNTINDRDFIGFNVKYSF
jgi:hypothetical protein